MQLGAPEAAALTCLAALHVNHCRAVTNAGLLRLRACANLARIDAAHTGVRPDGLAKFVQGGRASVKECCMLL